MFAADRIAISNDGRTLYWQALTGQTLHGIDTELLRPKFGERARRGREDGRHDACRGRPVDEQGGRALP
jgi:hypothetical protein